MDSGRFDALIRAFGGLERRQLLALLPATVALALVEPEAEGADKKTRKQRERKRRKNFNRRWKRKTYRCVSFQDRIIRCLDNQICCNPDRSNTTGCVNYPEHASVTTCCSTGNSSGSYYAHPNNYRCCPTASEGLYAACPDDYPVCCPNACCAAGSDCSDLGTCMTNYTGSAPRHLVMPGH